MNITFAELDNFEIVNIFKYFDFPYVFISKSLEDKYYFNYYIEPLEDGTDKWLFSEISNVERLDILGRRVSMLEILNKLKDNLRLKHLYIVPEDGENCSTKFEIVTNNNFDPESFPKKDFYVQYDYHTDTELERVDHELIDASKFKLVLKNIQNTHDIQLDLLVDILTNFKRALKRIASDIGLSSIDLKVDSVQPSSFGLYLKADSDIFKSSEKSLGKMFELIETINTNTPEKIEKLIKEEIYSIQTIKEINELLKDIKQNKYTMSVQSIVLKDSTPIEVKFERHSYDKLDTISNILSKAEIQKEELTIEGTLITINTKRNNFNIKTSTEEFNGIMAPELFKKVKVEEISFTVPAEISAVIIKETQHNINNDDKKIKFILKEFSQVPLTATT